MRLRRTAALALGTVLLAVPAASPASAHENCVTTAGVVGMCADTAVSVVPSSAHCHIAWTTPPPTHYWCYLEFRAPYFKGSSTLPGTLTGTLTSGGATQSITPCQWATSVNGSCADVTGLVLWREVLLHCGETGWFSATARATTTTAAGSKQDAHSVSGSVSSPAC